MKDILLLGAGKIGAIMTELLVVSGDYHVTVADIQQEVLDRIPNDGNVDKKIADMTSDDQLLTLLHKKFAVLSALPFHLTGCVATLAVQQKVHYLDLTEDVECTNNVKALANIAECALIPQCSLAPGFITIVANDLAKTFDEINNIHMRVGALPKYPANALKYNSTWSTAGLINEYCKPCEAIADGQLVIVPPLEELETFCLDGVTYEAFNTSGGLGTLCEILQGKVHNLNYRSVRYPGHRDIMKLLLQDLRLQERQDLLIEIFENTLPKVTQDMVLIFVNVNGMRDGQLVEVNYANKIYNQEINGKEWSAIQITTASGICTVLDLLAEGKIANRV